SLLLFLRWSGFLFFFLSRRWLLRFRLRLLFLFLFGFLFFLCRFLFFFFFRSFLTFSTNERDLIADVHFSALFNVNFGERSVLGRFPFHCRLVGFDFSDYIAG